MQEPLVSAEVPSLQSVSLLTCVCVLICLTYASVLFASVTGAAVNASTTSPKCAFVSFGGRLSLEGLIGGRQRSKGERG